MSSNFRTACERASAVPTAWKVMPRVHWSNGAIGSTLCRPYIDMMLHRDHAGGQILV